MRNARSIDTCQNFVKTRIIAPGKSPLNLILEFQPIHVNPFHANRRPKGSPRVASLARIRESRVPRARVVRPTRARVRGGSSRETAAAEEGDERKVRKEARRRSLVQTEEPVFAPHAARRVCTSPRSITFAYLLLLLPSPAFCLHFFPPLLLSLSLSLSRAPLSRRQRAASPGRRLLKSLSRRQRNDCCCARHRDTARASL